jgi:hypothetical protein
MERARAKARTVYGLSEETVLLKSLRQGDPLASLLYVIFIDPLHVALDKFGAGYVMKNGIKIGSLGFMDDTAIVAASFRQVLVSHRIVLEFSLLNGGELNATKTHLLLADHRGRAERRALLVPGDPPRHVRAEDPQSTNRYLGLWVNLAGGWDVMDQVVSRAFWFTYATISNNNITLKAAALLINSFLVPTIQRALRLARSALEPAVGAELQRKQKILNRLMARINHLPLPTCWEGPLTPLLLGYKDM